MNHFLLESRRLLAEARVDGLVKGETVSVFGGWLVYKFGPAGCTIPENLDGVKATFFPYNDGGGFVQYLKGEDFEKTGVTYVVDTWMGRVGVLTSGLEKTFKGKVKIAKADAEEVVAKGMAAVTEGLGAKPGTLYPFAEAAMVGKGGGRSRSYHFFAVFERDAVRAPGLKAEAVAVSAYGKFGSTPKFVLLGEGKLSKMMDVARAKMKTKLNDYMKIDIGGWWGSDIEVYTNTAVY